MPAWSVKARRAPSRHSRNARAYGHTTTAMHKLSTPPTPANLSMVSRRWCMMLVMMGTLWACLYVSGEETAFRLQRHAWSMSNYLGKQLINARTIQHLHLRTVIGVFFFSAQHVPLPVRQPRHVYKFGTVDGEKNDRYPRRQMVAADGQRGRI